MWWSVSMKFPLEHPTIPLIIIWHRLIYGITKDILFYCKRAEVQQVKWHVIRNLHLEKRQKIKWTYWNGKWKRGKVKWLNFPQRNMNLTLAHLLVNCLVHHYKCISSYPIDTVMKLVYIKKQSRLSHHILLPQVYYNTLELDYKQFQFRTPPPPSKNKHKKKELQ